MPTATEPDAGASLRSSDATAEERTIAAKKMGSVKSEKKAEKARENGNTPKSKFSDGRPRLPLDEIACTCGAGMALEGHRWDCPRGQAIKRRKKAGAL